MIVSDCAAGGFTAVLSSFAEADFALHFEGDLIQMALVEGVTARCVSPDFYYFSFFF